MGAEVFAETGYQHMFGVNADSGPKDVSGHSLLTLIGAAPPILQLPETRQSVLTLEQTRLMLSEPVSLASQFLESQATHSRLISRSEVA